MLGDFIESRFANQLVLQSADSAIKFTFPDEAVTFAQNFTWGNIITLSG